MLEGVLDGQCRHAAELGINRAQLAETSHMDAICCTADQGRRRLRFPRNGHFERRLCVFAAELSDEVCGTDVATWRSQDQKVRLASVCCPQRPVYAVRVRPI